ncbi:MAG: hypothetical protein Q4F49_04995 [Pseudoxanthomonas suwonensis]|nr:hypothetical protein [Pseudoxanthomonas suwonensis]
MRHLITLPALLLLSSLATGSALARSTPDSGDTLLIERVNAPAAATPVRGASMAQVTARFGAPLERLDARGGQKRQWPTINRWRYPDFIVYFERDRVIDVVAIQASATEAGPRPPIR